MFEKVICATEWDGCWFCSKCYSMHHWKEKAWRRTGKYEQLCENCKNTLDKQSKVCYNKYTPKERN
jgi:hypothetical protein